MAYAPKPTSGTLFARVGPILVPPMFTYQHLSAAIAAHRLLDFALVGRQFLGIGEPLGLQPAPNKPHLHEFFVEHPGVEVRRPAVATTDAADWHQPFDT